MGGARADLGHATAHVAGVARVHDAGLRKHLHRTRIPLGKFRAQELGAVIEASSNSR